MDTHEEVVESTARQTRKARGVMIVPLAAQFEDCVQAASRVCAALEGNTLVPEQAPLRKLAGKCLRRLTLWGHDTRASSRILNHSLTASKSRTCTLALLKALRDRIVLGEIFFPYACIPKACCGGRA